MVTGGARGISCIHNEFHNQRLRVPTQRNSSQSHESSKLQERVYFKILPEITVEILFIKLLLLSDIYSFGHKCIFY